MLPADSSQVRLAREAAGAKRDAVLEVVSLIIRL